MKTYTINGKKFILRDFLFGELDKVQELKKRLAPELFAGKKTKKVEVMTSTSEIIDMLNFILEAEDGGKAVVTESDVMNTGVKEFSTIIADFLVYELINAEEKKRDLQNLMKNLTEQ